MSASAKEDVPIGRINLVFKDTALGTRQKVIVLEKESNSVFLKRQGEEDLVATIKTVSEGRLLTLGILKPFTIASVVRGTFGGINSSGISASGVKKDNIKDVKTEKAESKGFMYAATDSDRYIDYFQRLKA